MTAKLVVLAGPRCGETFVVDGPTTTVGRDAGSHLNIPDHLMSRRHCALERSNGVKKDAAETMGISQRALSYYLAKHRIE